jgi:hypothetical protein
MSPNYVSRLSLIHPISLNYALWGLKDDVRQDIAKDRIASGISRTDTYNFESFMAAVITNGIIHIEVTTHPLHKGSAWIDFLSANPDVNEASFEDALLLIAESLSEYHASSDAFMVHRGQEKLNRVLKTFLALFPHLRQYASGSTTPFAETMEEEEVGTEPNEYHQRERVEYAVSYNDSIDLSAHLAKIFARGFGLLAKHTHSHPNEMSFGHWQAELRVMSDAFHQYHINGTPLSDEIKDEFVSKFCNYWD